MPAAELVDILIRSVPGNIGLMAAGAVLLTLVLIMLLPASVPLKDWPPDKNRFRCCSNKFPLRMPIGQLFCWDAVELPVKVFESSWW